jgi:hypothetical protein
VDFNKPTIRMGILTDDKSEEIDLDMVHDLLDQSSGIKYSSADEVTLNTDLMSGKYQLVLDYRGSRTYDEFKLISYQKEEKCNYISNLIKQALVDKKPIILSGMKKESLSVTERSMAMLLSLFMVFSTVYSSWIIKDKQNGTLQRYQFASNSNKGYILGYLLHGFMITFAQTLLSMALLLAVQKNFTPSMLEVLVLTIAIAAVSAIFGLLICLSCRSEVQANISASALAAVMSLLGGTFISVVAMPGLLRILSFASPIRWVVELLKVLP